MSSSQFDLVVSQIKLLPPDDLVRLIKKTAELLEEKQAVAPAQQAATKVDYVALIGSGKGLYASPEEADRFIREERDAWEE
ncbi:MAG: hypothetical protein AB7U82_24955 [Blastocatellales bacterium]